MLRERRYDVVVSVMEGPAAPLLLLRRLVGFTTPIVLWDIAPDDRWRLRTRLQDFVVPRLDGLMVLSSMQPAYIARRWSSRVPVTVIGHHIDTGFYRPADHGSGKDGSGKDGSGNDGSGNDSSGNDASGGGTGDVGGGEYILGVGEDIGRDYATLLAAMQGIPEELVLRTSLALPEAATQLPNLRLMRDRVSEPALRALYAKSRFVVVPLSDTLNASGVSTVLEAGAMGKATIVSASAAMDDFVVDNETCLRVPCHDEAALRAAILRLLNEPETCERLGRNARRFVVENCSRAAFAGRFAAALRAFAARVGYRQSASRSVASRMSASGPQ
jgi:glycosyltransferase involved in cell wall biosynthesis